MIPKMQNPGGTAGASRDRFGGWSRFADTFATALAQPPALPRLIALHLGAKAELSARSVRSGGGKLREAGQ